MRTILGQRPAFDRRAVGAEVKPDECLKGYEYSVGLEIIVVATITKGIDWAAYFGRGTDSMLRVADYGEKLPESFARTLFPGVEERYRL